MPLSDIYSVTLTSSLLSQECNNIFFYRMSQIGAGNPAEALCSGFEDLFFASAGTNSLRSVAFSTLIQYTRVRTYNLFSLEELFEIIFDPPYTGSGVGDTMPSFMAYPFRTAQVRRDVRRGQKRFAGVLESQVAGNTLIAGAITNLSPLTDTLSAAINPVDFPGFTFEPVVVKRIPIINEEGDVTGYRLPTNQLESVYAPATTWELVTVLTSQRSRKQKGLV